MFGVHFFPGFSGVATAVSVLGIIFIMVQSKTIGDEYAFGPQGNNERFEPTLTRYLKLAEFTIGLATGGIVLIVGSSALHQGGRLPWFLASPLLVISACVVYGILFMTLINFTYEGALHGSHYTREQYILNQTFGFGSLACFVIGYIWLVISATR